MFKINLKTILKVLVENYKELCLFCAGLFSSVAIMSITATFPKAIISTFLAIIFILLACGVGAGLYHNYIINRRQKKKIIGILSDMKWDHSDTEISAWTDIEPEEWLEEFKKQANGDKNLIVKLITTDTNFNCFYAIVNPYGGVYPEKDLKNFQTLNKIFQYVENGGLYINVADIPGYWAYNPLLKRRLDTTPPIYAFNDNKLIPLRFFERTPFMERLGLRVINTEASIIKNWDGQVGDAKLSELNVSRVVVIEKNVISIMDPKELSIDKVTPLFYAKYGEGVFLISLFFFDDKLYLKNRKVKELLVSMVIKNNEVVVEKKRSIGVTIFAVLIIFSTLLLTLYSLTPKAIAAILLYYLKPYGIIFYILGIFFSLFEIVLGINVLRLKEWARKSLIVLMMIYMVYMFLTPLFENKEFTSAQDITLAQSIKVQKVNEEAMVIFEERIKKLPNEQQEILKLRYYKILETIPRVARLTATGIIYGVFFLWYLFVIFFFTRPKVKAQFK